MGVRLTRGNVNRSNDSLLFVSLVKYVLYYCMGEQHPRANFERCNDSVLSLSLGKYVLYY